MDEKPLYTIPCFCDTFDVSRSKTYDLIGSGQLKAVKIGRRTYLRYEDIREWLRKLKSYETS